MVHLTGVGDAAKTLYITAIKPKKHHVQSEKAKTSKAHPGNAPPLAFKTYPYGRCFLLPVLFFLGVYSINSGRVWPCRIQELSNQTDPNHNKVILISATPSEERYLFFSLTALVFLPEWLNK